MRRALPSAMPGGVVRAAIRVVLITVRTWPPSSRPRDRSAAQRSRASTLLCAWSSPAASCAAMWRHCSTMARSPSPRNASALRSAPSTERWRRARINAVKYASRAFMRAPPGVPAAWPIRMKASPTAIMPSQRGSRARRHRRHARRERRHRRARARAPSRRREGGRSRRRRPGPARRHDGFALLELSVDPGASAAQRRVFRVRDDQVSPMRHDSDGDCAQPQKAGHHNDVSFELHRDLLHWRAAQGRCTRRPCPGRRSVGALLTEAVFNKRGVACRPPPWIPASMLTPLLQGDLGMSSIG